MADAVSNTSKAQKLAPHLSSDHTNPSKYFTHFLYKAALVTVFLVLLPLFPSLAPEFINQTLHARSWELLQLIFVGIAVSYGLFSKKNDETEKDHGSKLDNAQSYVSKLLQVSSVFDDESENQTVIDDNKIQTWSSQYYRGEPVVVVAKESPIVGKEENGALASEISQKPLLLPVRSLKQRVSDPNEVDLAYESGVRNGSGNLSNSKRFTFNSKGLSVQKSDGQLEENLVLRSPIPWRSRSGRIEMKESGDSPGSSTLEEAEPNRNKVLESRSSRSLRPNSSAKNLSPSTSFSSESQAKAREDVVRKKTSSSPPPPPPPPPIHRKSMLMKSNSSVTNNAPSSDKVLNRSIRNVPAEEPPQRMNSDGLRQSVRTLSSSDYETKLVETKAVMETSDEESEGESEVDYYSEGRSGEAAADNNNNDNSENDVGPDVDKKADEFIAKFREQIRLQRIESIRKSTAQRAGKSVR